ncbi:MAG: hypothetical protein H7Z75_14625 [Ferruginibacter sp.]|nr:hypothetical protein [Cytophagales bacterium]
MGIWTEQPCRARLGFEAQISNILKQHKKMEDKKYTQNGKTIKIIPIKKVKKTENTRSTPEDGDVKMTSKKKTKKAEDGKAKFAVDDKVSLKNIPAEYAGAGFAESLVIKVFKSTHDQMYRYSIRSAAGRELPLVKEDQLKPRK